MPKKVSDRPSPVSWGRDEETGQTLVRLTVKTVVTTVFIIVSTMLSGFAGWIAFASTLVRVDDLSSHDTSASAHPVVMMDSDGHPQPPKPIAQVVVENAKAVAEMPAKLEKINKTAREAKTAAIVVKNGFFEQRAEGVAQRAVDQMPEGTPRRRLGEKYEQVKDRALDNLNNERPIHDGMQRIY